LPAPRAGDHRRKVLRARKNLLYFDHLFRRWKRTPPAKNAIKPIKAIKGIGLPDLGSRPWESEDADVAEAVPVADESAVAVDESEEAAPDA